MCLHIPGIKQVMSMSLHIDCRSWADVGNDQQRWCWFFDVEPVSHVRWQTDICLLVLASQGLSDWTSQTALT